MDFGIDKPANLDDLVEQLGRHGPVEVQERSADTVHLLWKGIKVSAFAFPILVRHCEERHLTVTGVLATKLHVILDRGMRRDFFDLYVMLQQHQLGIASLLSAVRNVYEAVIDEGLLLRALTYFDDADPEAPLPRRGGVRLERGEALLPGAGGKPDRAADAPAGDSGAGCRRRAGLTCASGTARGGTVAHCHDSRASRLEGDSR